MAAILESDSATGKTRACDRRDLRVHQQLERLPRPPDLSQQPRKAYARTWSLRIPRPILHRLALSHGRIDSRNAPAARAILHRAEVLHTGSRYFGSERIIMIED